jgi:hypothetical protein
VELFYGFSLCVNRPKVQYRSLLPRYLGLAEQP